ncbi:hypothetical protein E3N88_01408 [Mikania micrantha]|uniref:Uncharacterized protein n=1 Tax=Mikania micrantha TaxID=192012 RepID=A0A5N6Q145_9ASTR|nr:hypothetical protein E3N88_01408 [Mikania micrantha]
MLGELTELIGNLPGGSASDRRDLIRCTLYVIGVLTIIIGTKMRVSEFGVELLQAVVSDSVDNADDSLHWEGRR